MFMRGGEKMNSADGSIGMEARADFSKPGSRRIACAAGGLKR
jgi:hypothetical protein